MGRLTKETQKSEAARRNRGGVIRGYPILAPGIRRKDGTHGSPLTKQKSQIAERSILSRLRWREIAVRVVSVLISGTHGTGASIGYVPTNRS